MKTLRQVLAERQTALLATCVSTGFGTLWRVREDLWADKLANVVRYVAKRQWHPGVSLRIKPATSLFEYIPMLHGTSGAEGPVVVSGITLHKGPDHKTSFGRILKPAPVCCGEIFEVSKSPVADVPKDDALRSRRVAPNCDKSRVDVDEEQSLVEWARGKGLL